VLNYFNTEPKQFSGGEIVLKSHNSTKEATIEPVNNRIVIIASCTLHEVKELKSQLNNTYSGDGRYCNAIFLTYIDQRQIQNDSN
jgi:Rps23 Pro-64 3,4-dihydroxylase Tpa1-like proline 4-hydroxylase